MSEVKQLDKMSRTELALAVHSAGVAEASREVAGESVMTWQAPQLLEADGVLYRISGADSDVSYWAWAIAGRMFFASFDPRREGALEQARVSLVCAVREALLALDERWKRAWREGGCSG